MSRILANKWVFGAQNAMQAHNCHYLIAMPALNDPYFDHGVVLMIHHHTEGAVGFLINKPLEMTLGQFALSKDVPCHKNLEHTPVYLGGPVEKDHGWILHTDPHIDEKQEIMPGVFLSATLDSLYELMKKGSTPVKLILGYAGWSPHQLEEEMQVGSWLSQIQNPKYLFETDPKETWLTILKDLGVDPAQLTSVSGIH